MRSAGSIGEHIKEHSVLGSFFTVGQIIANYVPYTGAAKDIDLGAKNFTTTGTLTAGQIIDSGLTANLGVYTDVLKQLTSTAPTSGILGYWSRAGTDLSQSNANDALELGSGNVTSIGIGTFGANNQLKFLAPVGTTAFIGKADDTDLLALVANLLTVNGALTVTGTVQAEHLNSTDDAVIDDNLTVSGVMAVGTSPDEEIGINLSKTFTGAITGNSSGLSIIPNFNWSSGGSINRINRGMNFNPQYSSAEQAKEVGGAGGNVLISGNATVGDHLGFSTQLAITAASAVVTNTTGFKMIAPAFPGANPANLYGLWLPDLSSGGTSSSQAILVEGGDVIIRKDNSKLKFGGAYDVSIYFDNADMIINSENVTAADEVHFTNFDKYTFDNDISTDGFLIVPKASGNGIKIDTTTPTFGFADIIGDQFAKNTGASKPVLTTYNGAINGWQFGVGDEAYMTFHIPHDYVLGTPIFLHIHWSHIVTTVTGGTVTFKATSILAKAHNQQPFQSVPSVGTFTGTASTVQYQQILSEVLYSDSTPTGIQVDTDNLEPDSVIEMTFEVDANGITVSSGGVPDPFIHYVDIHYQTTSIIGTKSKAPDFYV